MYERVCTGARYRWIQDEDYHWSLGGIPPYMGANKQSPILPFDDVIKIHWTAAHAYISRFSTIIQYHLSGISYKIWQWSFDVTYRTPAVYILQDIILCHFYKHGPLWRECNSHRWISLTWYTPQRAVEQTVETPTIWNAITVMRRHSKAYFYTQKQRAYIYVQFPCRI